VQDDQHTVAPKQCTLEKRVSAPVNISRSKHSMLPKKPPQAAPWPCDTAGLKGGLVIEGQRATVRVVIEHSYAERE
jgi:hypothetical protein